MFKHFNNLQDCEDFKEDSNTNTILMHLSLMKKWVHVNVDGLHSLSRPVPIVNMETTEADALFQMLLLFDADDTFVEMNLFKTWTKH